MTSLDSYLVFFFIVMAITASPGPAILLAVYNSVNFGFKSACWGIAGNLAAMLLLAVVSGVGLGALIVASESLFWWVKVIGGGYLIYLGIRALMARPQAVGGVADVTIARPKRRVLFSQAFMTGMSNPKAIAFYVALFPQFIHHQQPLYLELAPLILIFSLCSVGSLLFYAALAHKAKRWLQRPHVAVGFKRVMGSMFIAIGGSLLFSQR